MKPGCERMDPDLLLLVHRQLEGWPAVRLKAHLLVCPHCRARRRKIDALSGSLAVAFANPKLGMRAFRRPPRTAWTSIGVVVVLFTILGWLVSVDAAMASSGTRPSPGNAVSVPSTCDHVTVAPMACEKSQVQIMALLKPNYSKR